MLISHLTSLGYIEVVREILETPFQTLEIDVVSQRQDTHKKKTNPSSWEKL